MGGVSGERTGEGRARALPANWAACNEFRLSFVGPYGQQSLQNFSPHLDTLRAGTKHAPVWGATYEAPFSLFD